MTRDDDDDNDNDSYDSDDENDDQFYINILSKSNCWYTTCTLSSCN